MKCKNKEVKTIGVRYDIGGDPLQLSPIPLWCMITNDAIGKTLSVDDGKTQFSIKITEEILKYLKD